MRRALGCVLCAVFVCTAGPRGMAQDPIAAANWAACLKAPTRACILDQALVDALSAEPALARTSALAKIAEAQAAAGHFQVALQTAQSIPSDLAARVAAMRSIAVAQAQRRLVNEARETLVEARQLVRSLRDQVARAEALLSVAVTEADSGMAAKAAETLQESARFAESLRTPAAPIPCQTAPVEEVRLDGLFHLLALQQVKAGNISDALRAARSVIYASFTRADTLREIADMQAESGHKDEAGLVMLEVLASAHGELHCPGTRRKPPRGSAGFTVEKLCSIAVSQAKAGLGDDATATFGEVLQIIEDIEDDPGADASGAVWFWRADVFKVNELSQLAKAQSDAGFRTQSATTFERATGAAMALGEPRHRVGTLARLARDQFQAGRAAEATRALDSALHAARAVTGDERAFELLTVLAARAEAGPVADADAVLAEVRDAVRPMTGPLAASRRVQVFHQIALVQEKIGRRENAVATYREALETADAIGDKATRSTALILLIQGVPVVSLQEPRLIAETAQEAARIVQSMAGEPRRSLVLVAIANALTN